MESENNLNQKISIFFQIISNSLFMLNILSTLDRNESTKHLAKNANAWLYYLEIFIMIQLTLEFALRIWSCGCRSRYQGFWGRMLFMKRFFCLLDLVIVCGSIISTIVTETETTAQNSTNSQNCNDHLGQFNSNTRKPTRLNTRRQ